jgi:glucuronate isomerase
MSDRLVLDPDRLFSPEARQRAIARELYEQIVDLPLLSPHGHTDPRWFADNEPFDDPTSLLVTPDHYLTRMLYSQGVPLESLGVAPLDGGEPVDPRLAWRTFATNYHLFRGTPSGLWMNHVLHEVFGVTVRLTEQTADDIFDLIDDCLRRDEFRPRALLDRFRIEVVATTDSPLSGLRHHRRLCDEGLAGRVIPTFRPDTVADPDDQRFVQNIATLGELTGRDTTRWDEYLAALFERRQLARSLGATATDHGPPTAFTASLDAQAATALFTRALTGSLDDHGKELLRGQILVEMAAMSVEDGLVMQLHAGSRRNHNAQLFSRFGRDVGADIPGPVDYVDGLRALLDRFGNDARFRLVVFTLDESTFSRELAPLAGHYPAMSLGPPWWFLDSVEGMLRYRRSVTETAGFANTSGFVDDTRAFLSIPARHDVARRVDCRYLAELVSDHRLELDDAHDIARELTVDLPRRVFKLESGVIGAPTG